MRSTSSCRWAVLVMGVTSSVVAIARDIPGSIAAGPLVAYYVVTGGTAVRPLGREVWIAFDDSDVYVSVSARI